MLKLVVDFNGVLENGGETWIKNPYTSNVKGAPTHVAVASPYPGSIEAINKLSRYYEIIVVSMLPDVYYIRDTCVAWFPGIHVYNVICTTRKDLISCDIRVDDSVNNLTGPGIPVLFGNSKGKFYSSKWEGARAANWEVLTEMLVKAAVKYYTENDIEY